MRYHRINEIGEKRVPLHEEKTSTSNQYPVEKKLQAGGYLVGKSHAEGGIKAVNKSNGQPLEMEGGEVVITKSAVSDKKKRMFEGKMMTNREILSAINQSGGGVAFAEGGEVPDHIEYDDSVKYHFRGKNIGAKEVIEYMAKGGQTAIVNNKSIAPVEETVDMGLIRVPYKQYQDALRSLSDEKYKDAIKDFSEFIQLVEFHEPEVIEKMATAHLAATDAIKLLESQVRKNQVKLMLKDRLIDEDYNDIVAEIARLNKKIKNYYDVANPQIFVKNLIEAVLPYQKSYYNPSDEIDVNLLETIKTPEFKAWFGDWEAAKITSNYEQVSAGIDENGMPKPYYRGGKRIITRFDPIKGKNSSTSIIYFGAKRSYAEWFARNGNSSSDVQPNIMAAFVSCKNPIDLRVFGVKDVDILDVFRYIKAMYHEIDVEPFIPKNILQKFQVGEKSGVTVKAWQIIRKFDAFNQWLANNTHHEGWHYYENNPEDIIDGKENVTEAFAVFRTTAIKLLNAHMFSTQIDDVRFADGGVIDEDLVNIAKMSTGDFDVLFEDGGVVKSAATKKIRHKKGVIHKTGYKPSFAVKSIRSMFEKYGFEVDVDKAISTNSVYLTGYQLDSEGLYKRLAEVRISDHTKPKLDMTMPQTISGLEFLKDTKIERNGQPLIVYRSQKDDRKQTAERQSGHYGIYFSENKESTRIYGNKTTEYYLNIKNPKVLKDAEWNLSVMPKYLYDSLRNEGYDGAVWLRKGEMYEIIAFDESQVIPKTLINTNQDLADGGVFRSRYDNFEAEILNKEQFTVVKQELEKWLSSKSESLKDD